MANMDILFIPSPVRKWTVVQVFFLQKVFVRPRQVAVNQFSDMIADHVVLVAHHHFNRDFDTAKSILLGVMIFIGQQMKGASIHKETR